MRLAGLVSKGYPFSSGEALHGGAQISQLELLAALTTQYGHDCQLLTEFPTRERAQFAGVRIASFRDREELWQMVEALSPDAILGALSLNCEAVRIAKHLRIPSLLFLHAYEAAPLTPPELRRFGMSGTETVLSEQEWSFAWKGASRVYACSRYLRDYVSGKRRRRIRVLYPEFAPKRTLVRDAPLPADAFITGICGLAHKGAQIFLDLSRAFPAERFQLFGNIEPALRTAFEQQPNITLRPHAELHTILQAAKIVVVPSQWPEPFGRIAVEAMANGIPVLVSASGGLLEAAPDPRLQVQAFRQTKAWENRLADVLRNSHENGVLGRKLAAGFLRGHSACEIDGELRTLVKRSKPRPSQTQMIALCGNHSAQTTYSLVNNHLAASTCRWTTRRVASIPAPDAFLAERLNVLIHHDYARDFKSIEFPGEGKVVAIRTWDFGKYPVSWVDKINEQVDQLWVHCRWVRDHAIRSAIPASKVRVIPLGVDEQVFHPQGASYVLPTRKQFRFLFVGRTIVRKGIDILLAAFAKAFTPDDDVCLVVKDNPNDVFYKGIDFRSRILELAADPAKPEIVYIDKYLSTSALASLYRACDAGVFPYRAEGFCLPILEAMACGVPSIVPRFGACLDFCSDQNAFFVAAKRINLPIHRIFAINTLGFEEQVDEVDFCEVPVDALAERMREVYLTSGKDGTRRSREAVRTARSFCWSDTIARMDECLNEVASNRTPIRLENRRRLNQRHKSLFNAAKELYLTRVESGSSESI